MKEATRPKNIPRCRVKIPWGDKTRAHAKPMRERPSGPEGGQTMIGTGNLGTGCFDPARSNLPQNVHFAQPLTFPHKPSPGSTESSYRITLVGGATAPAEEGWDLLRAHSCGLALPAIPSVIQVRHPHNTYFSPSLDMSLSQRMQLRIYFVSSRGIDGTHCPGNITYTTAGKLS